MYHPAGAHEKDVSTRLMKPTQPLIAVDDVLFLVENWKHSWEYDGAVIVHDAGIAQYMLVGDQSHSKFFAALILGKPSLRCKIIDEEPRDVLDNEADNVFTLVENEPISEDRLKKIEFLKNVLKKKGYRFER